VVIVKRMARFKRVKGRRYQNNSRCFGWIPQYGALVSFGWWRLVSSFVVSSLHLCTLQSPTICIESHLIDQQSAKSVEEITVQYLSFVLVHSLFTSQSPVKTLGHPVTT